MRAKLASQNENKLRELRHALPGWELELLDAHDYPQESGATYYENALGKARHGVEHAGTWVLGEDSGIEVRALDGRPGVESARGADDGGGALREARYVCELVALSPDGGEHRGRGTVEGAIAREPRGSEGFGYDPIFVPRGETRTVAELGNEWKREHSHRALAARALAVALEPK